MQNGGTQVGENSYKPVNLFPTRTLRFRGEHLRLIMVIHGRKREDEWVPARVLERRTTSFS